MRRSARHARFGCAGRFNRSCASSTRTTWSDGALPVPDLVDLYGRSGFDVLCITDHVNRTDDPWLPAGASLAELEREAERARADYDLLLLDGIDAALADARAAGGALIAAHPFRSRRAGTPGHLTLRMAPVRHARRPVGAVQRL